MDGARRARPSSPALQCGALLRAPNEVAAPDFGLFRDVLNGHFYPARVEPLERIERRAALGPPRITAAHLPVATIAYVSPGTTATVDPGNLSAYHVNVALSGSVASQCGDQQTVATPHVATVFSPDRHTALPRWAADAAQLSIKLPRHRVEEELAALLGRPVGTPIDFRLAFSVDDGGGRRWMAVLSALLASIDAAGDTPGGSRGDGPHRHHLELLERSLISGLLLAQPHSYSDQLVADARRAPRATLDRVVEEIRRAPDRGYTVADLARIAGTSARSLQYCFQDAYGLSPMRYLRQVRLDRAHDDLAEGAGSVADIAAHWGFTNPGRFARAYRERFGEFPATTRSRIVV